MTASEGPEPLTDAQVDISPKQTFAAGHQPTRRSALDPVAKEFVGGDQALVLGGKVAASDRVPEQ